MRCSAWGAYFIADALKAELVPGDIVVRSGNEEITALQNVTGEQRKNGSKACGGHFEIEEVADEFPSFAWIKASCLKPRRIPTARCITRFITRISPSFTTAASGLRTLKTTGTYYVVIDTAWGDKNHYFSTEHGFTLVIENSN